MDYIDQLYKSYYPEMTLPLLIIAGILAVLTYLCALGMFRTLRMPRARLRAFACMTEVLYYYMVLMSTVFTRLKHADMKYNLELFWSYKRAFAGDKGLALEIVLNMVMFLPMGFLITYVIDFIAVFVRKRGFRKAVIRLSLLVGFVCSAAIEVLQLLLHRGLFEWDDMVSNTIGFLIGAGVYLLVCRCVGRRR